MKASPAWYLPLVGFPVLGAGGWVSWLALGNDTLLSISCAIGGTALAVFFVPYSLGALFPRAFPSRHVAETPPTVVYTQGPVRVERVVERQVVVTRCPYCSTLTPVDVAGCQNCGSPLR